MSRRSCLVLRFFIVALLAASSFMLSGCASEPRARTEDPDRIRTGKRLAFLGFRAALPPGHPPEVVRNPVSGSLFRAEPVLPEATELLDTMLLDRLARFGDEVIPPEESHGFLSRVMAGDAGADLAAIEVFGEVGKAMNADGVLVGYVYRWQEREGSDFAVEEPASAAFDLNLIRSSDGVLVWRGKFDRTQRSLSENVLDFVGFFKRGGRWVKVEDFAVSGLDALMEDYSGISSGEI